MCSCLKLLPVRDITEAVARGISGVDESIIQEEHESAESCVKGAFDEFCRMV